MTQERAGVRRALAPRRCVSAQLVLLGLLAAGCAQGVLAIKPVPLPPDVLWPATTGLRAGATFGHIEPLVERAEALPVYVSPPGVDSPLELPGLSSVKRTRTGAVSGRLESVQLALAEPLLVFSFKQAGKQAPRRIALTFDDGPNGTYTPQLLDILKQHKAHATLFLLGVNARNCKQLIGRMSAEGHEIAVHTWAHSNLTKLSNSAIKQDLERCRALLEPLIDHEIRWVRPPYGAVNARVRKAINDAGYRVAMWSVDPKDWTRPGSSVVAERVLDRVRDGSVVVLHDGGGNRLGTVKAVGKIVPALLERGYELVTMSELVGLVTPPAQEEGMLLTIGDRQFRVEAGFDDVKVRVDGAEVAMAAPPVQIEGQFLLHGRPVLEALGAHCQWEPENLALEVLALRGRYLVKLDTCEMIVNGRETLLETPAVLYHGQVFLPARLIGEACGASVTYSGAEHAIDYVSALSMGLGWLDLRRPGPPAGPGIHGSKIAAWAPRTWQRPAWDTP